MGLTSVRLDDMRMFAAIAGSTSFTAAARTLGMPKQTLSRRVAELERALGVELVFRTTRQLQLSDVGVAYAARCAELVQLAAEANDAVLEAGESPRGTLRVSADPVFGEAFLSELIVELARRCPALGVDVQLTRRRVDLIDERFDVAFRIGELDDPALRGFELGPARVRYCASPRYLRRRGAPNTPEALSEHDCIVISSEPGAVRWPFTAKRGLRSVAVVGRARFSSIAMARDAAVAGLGVALFPEFACDADIRAGRLVPLLEAFTADVGAVWLVHPATRALPARVKVFIELVRERFARRPPWVPAPSGAVDELHAPDPVAAPSAASDARPRP